jgi:hypothetical protein
MINIKNHGTYRKFKHFDCLCPLCGCQFTCENEDLVTIEEGPTTTAQSGALVPSYIIQELRCPDCKYALEDEQVIDIFEIYEYGTNTLLREEQDEHV